MLETDLQVGVIVSNFDPMGGLYKVRPGQLRSAENIGIGDYSTGVRLDVNGEARVHALTLSMGDQRIQGPVYDYRNDGLPILPFLALRADDYYTVLVPHQSGFRVTDHENRWNNIRLDDNGMLFIRNDVWVSGNQVHYSDSQIKLDQKELDYGLEKVMAVKSKRYNSAKWERDIKTGKITIFPEKKKNDIGFIAQELLEVIPEAVVDPEEEGDKLLGIAYHKLIPVLFKAIQEQQKQIEKMEDKIERLEKRIKDEAK